MQSLWLLLLAVQILYSSAAFTNTKTFHEQRLYSNQFRIRLPTAAEKLEFVPADESEKTVLWSRFTLTKKGYVTGKDDNRDFTMSSVNFDDEGTYTVTNFWNQKIYIYLLKVNTKTDTQNCVAGETLNIYLSGIATNDATLHFSNEDYNLTLVKRGLVVGNSHPDFMGRIKITSGIISVLSVNVSDVGNYTLSDGLNRKAKIIYMRLVDHHEGMNAAPFVGLLALLGLPACVFCCCKKRVCRKNQAAATTVNTTTLKMDDQMHPPGPPPAYGNLPAPTGPIQGYTPGYPAVGDSIVHPPPNPTFPPQPAYNGYPATSPAMPPNPGYTPGYPAVGDSIVHPPPNPTFPPQPHINSGYPATSPAMPPNPAFNPGYPPAAGFPPAHSPYNPPAVAGFAPVMSSAPEPVKGEINPTTPLLTPPQPEASQPPAPYPGINALNSSDSAAQFNINMGKESGSNFL